MTVWAQHSFQIRPDDNISARIRTIHETEDHWIKFRDGSDFMDFSQFVIVGATLSEAQAVADAINAAISNAKARADLADEPIAEAAE
jgi:hypothetical protein